MANVKGAELVRPCILGNDPNLPEQTNEELKKEFNLKEVLSFNCNENPLGTSPKAIAAIQEHAKDVFLYPDATCTELRRKVAKANGIDEMQVLFGNGADNVLLMLTETFLNEGEEMIVGSPHFFVYNTTVQLVGGKLVTVPLKNYTVDLKAIKAAITPKTKLIMVCNPNNPTGTIVKEDEVKEFMKDIPDNVIVIFDEAYAEFVDAADYPNSLQYVNAGKKVLVIRTLSKIFGMAGCRIGYIMGPEYLIELMRRTVEYFAVNRVAQDAALAAMDDEEFLHKTLAVNKEGKEYLTKEFTAMGFTCQPSYTNFIFVDFHRDAREIADKLRRQGLLIAVGGGWNCPTCSRISIGTMEMNKKLVAAFKEILA
ncbi:MAG: histidinol-phosphate transaminase [Firmicutes bacterium]|nr:histidinol-phosphate transaminase [Bacillota bacterium]